MFAESEARLLAKESLEMLSVTIGSRPAGSEGQRRSEEYITAQLSRLGLAVEVQRTDCPVWHANGVSLRLGGRQFEALANPFSPACSVSGPLVCLQTLADLQQASLAGRIAVLRGELTAAAYMPRNFDLFRDEMQDAAIAALEEKQPLAVITVSRHDAPIPLMEDAAFTLPTVAVSREAGQALTAAQGQTAQLVVDSARQEGNAATIVARGSAVADGRVVVCAHYDTKRQTPGAIDNASGVAAVLTMARLLHHRGCLGGVELVLFGGEDSWYPSDAAYFDRSAGYFPTVQAAVNVDSVGVKGRRDSVTFLQCPEPMVNAILALKADFPQVVQVEPWYEGDHTLFSVRGIPSIAVGTERVHDLINTVIHTPLDTIERVDPDRILQVAQFLCGAVQRIGRR